MADIEIEIDGQTFTAKPNQTVIQVADEAGVYIPRFCYHPHLSIPANCRMCLVEVEKMPKAVPACATPVAPGMKVYTKSQKTRLAQRAVMEFLLINHPLDCPICDQGGECELQDLSMGYGAPDSRYRENKRSVADQNLGPLVATEMTRCIYCTRCVRFGDEIAGIRELGALGRGEFTEIGTYIQHALKSEVSGNIIDLCPVGALTSKPFRFTSRSWELDQAESISPHDCIGSNLEVHTRYGKVMRVVAKENAMINQTWIADRDRFSYTALYHPDRLKVPLARINNQWEEVSWEKAFELAAQGFKKVRDASGADAIGGLASASSTIEEFYLFQKLLRGLGSSNIDYRLKEMDTADDINMPLYPALDLPLVEVEDCDAILLIASNIQKEQPIFALKIRQAVRKGAEVSVIHSVDYDFNFTVMHKTIVAPHQLVGALEQLLDRLKANDSPFREKKRVVILMGALACHHPDASRLRYLTQEIAKLTEAKIGWMTSGANAAGAWIAGAVPHREVAGKPAKKLGLNAYQMLEQPRQAYLLLNVEPELECANPFKAVQALKQAKWLVALSIYRNEVLESHADVILPMSPFTETSGTYVNVNGDWQSFKGVATSFEASRPAWKILRVLGNFLELDHFNYDSSEEIKHEIKHLFDQQPKTAVEFSPKEAKSFTLKQNQLMRIGETPLYDVDSVVRRSLALKEAQTLLEGDVKNMRIHPETAKGMQLTSRDQVRVKQGDAEAILSIEIDPRIAPESAWIASGIEETALLGPIIGAVDIEKVSE